jgi:hypothetical protein
MKLTGTYDIKTIENDVVTQHITLKNTIPESVLLGLLKYVFTPSNFGTYDANLKSSYSIDAMTSNNNYIPDLAGNSYQITLISGSGNSLVSGGVYRNALRMNGATGSAKFYNQMTIADAHNTATDFTIEGWIRTTTSVASFNPIFTMSAQNWNSTYPRGLLYLTNNVPAFLTGGVTGGASLYNAITSTLGAISLTNRWYHLAGVHSSTLGNFLFVDGVLAAKEPTYTGLPYVGSGSVTTIWNCLGGYAIGGTTPTYSAYLNGDIDNVATTLSSTKYNGTTVGVKYFEPSVLPHTRCRCYGENISTNSNYRPYQMILCNTAITAPTKFDGAFTDDYTQKGIWVRNGSYNYYNVDLNSQTDVNLLTATVSNNSIKLTVTIPENYAINAWNSLTITDTCAATKSSIGPPSDVENLTYPIISQLNFPSTIIKKRLAKLVLEWTVQLSNI